MLGGLSLVLAAINISMPLFIGQAGILAEAFLAGFATALVLAGILRGWHGDWLLRRYQAEQLRLAKFRFLVDPDFWCQGAASAPGSRDHFLREIERIEAIQEEDLASVAADDNVPTLPSDAACGSIPDALRLAILAYYRRQRLASQIEYFSATGRRKRRWYQSPALLPAVFFVSVLGVALHAWAHLAARVHTDATDAAMSQTHETHNAPESRIPRGVEGLGALALAISLGLPGGWAAVRTWRTANEFGRNRTRSLARFHSLSKIADRLRAEAPAEDVFSDLGLCEHILAADQGEWLRLMLEAEWYG